MTPVELKQELESLIVRLDEADESERPVKHVLVTLLASIETEQETLLWNHVRRFSWAMFRALSARRASRN